VYIIGFEILEVIVVSHDDNRMGIRSHIQVSVIPSNFNLGNLIPMVHTAGIQLNLKLETDGPDYWNPQNQ